MASRRCASPAGQSCTGPKGRGGGRCLRGEVGSPRRVMKENPKSQKNPKPQIPNPKKIPRSRANYKTPAVCNFQRPFPLTPALSLRERENQGPRWNKSKQRPFSNAPPMILPLPEGEGRGE